MIKMLSTLAAAFGVFLGFLLASSAYERATPSTMLVNAVGCEALVASGLTISSQPDTGCRVAGFLRFVERGQIEQGDVVVTIPQVTVLAAIESGYSAPLSADRQQWRTIGLSIAGAALIVLILLALSYRPGKSHA